MSWNRTDRSADTPLVLPGERQDERLPVPVVVHLSGPWRGTTQRLRGERLRIGAAMDAEVRVSPEPCVAPFHATLEPTPAGSFELVAETDRPVWVNGEPVRRRPLVSGDVLEIGRDGPLLRFRLYPPGTRTSKSVAEAFADGIAPARRSRRSTPARTALGVAGAVRELAARGPLWFRLTVLLLLAALATSTVLLQLHGRRLERRLGREAQRVEGLAGLLDKARPRLTDEELEAIRSNLVTAIDRVEALEARSSAPARVFAAASPSVALLQGSYGFDDPVSGQTLRILGGGADGGPLRGDTGEPLVGFGGDGPAVEVFFTGTAFLVGGDGLLLTNRHLAVPWRYDAAAQRAVSNGLRPTMRRFLAYLPGIASPFSVEPLQVSSSSDLAILLAPGLGGLAPPLSLRQAPPEPGEEVLVLGYPAGIPALLARTDERFFAELRSTRPDFWQVAARLAESGQIGPLASRGIIAQVSPSTIVYDAETTQGGSGGPVLGLDGQVVAVTSAIVTEFGGSNLGVPAAQARMLLVEAAMWRLLASLPR